MSRRTQRSDLEFGSDSFLDVVCNIVGILIILIVVVGVRVQRQPRQPVTPPVATAQT
ncbi:MAG: Ribonuclease, partial [Planctomycetota bacterium]